MNREIKFRAWTGEEMIYEGWGENKIYITKAIIFRYDMVMQYTGIKDKNGKEIYEGDIIQNQYGQRAIIDFQPPSFITRSYYTGGDSDSWPMPRMENEVIGNIYQNNNLI